MEIEPKLEATEKRVAMSVWLYHFLAAITVVIWGTTFVSTKILINEGLSPVEIFLYRFTLAYICMWAISRKKLWAHSMKDELLLLGGGVCGGSLYFIAENMALEITLASNVSLLICTAPIITAIFSRLFYKESIHRNFIYGSFIALLGVALVVFNGNYMLKINPLGDMLTLIAAASWALYCLVLKRLSRTYSTLFITRKVFFYGVLSLCFYFIFSPLNIKSELIIQPVVYLNLLFLGIVASMLCYIMWNCTLKVLGAAQTANYIYIVPLVTILTSALFLQEPIGIISLVGALCIIGGVYWAEKAKKNSK